MADWRDHARHRVPTAPGVELDVYEAGSGERTVVLLHGFPELAYSWRHQLPFLAENGFRVLAPDQRGYGRSSQSSDIAAYSVENLAADVVGVLDHFGVESATVIGHDWGAPVAWHTGLRHPGRVHAVGSLSVPHGRRANRPPLESMRELAGPDHVFYIDYFQEPGVAEAELSADVRAFLLGFLWCISGDAPPDERFRPIPRGGRFIDSVTVPAALPSWLTAEDLDVYTEAFSASGFTGGLNWYRNVNRNWEESADLAEATVQQPALFVTGSRDPARNPAAIERLGDVVPNLLVNEVLPGCGHWTQQERPDEVNRLLLSFLEMVG